MNTTSWKYFLLIICLKVFNWWKYTWSKMFIVQDGFSSGVTSQEFILTVETQCYAEGGDGEQSWYITPCVHAVGYT